MGAHLDLDDVTHGHPKAALELDVLRARIEEADRVLAMRENFRTTIQSLIAQSEAAQAELTALRQRLAEAERDVVRLDFLESLTKRVGISGHKQTPWPLDTDMHIGSRGASIYARTGIGSNTEFTVGGATVRGAIDAAMEKKS